MLRWTWHDLGHMSTKEAQKQYVDKLLEVDPAWKPSDEKQRSVYVSRMINLNPHSNEPLPTLDNDHSIFSLIKQHDLESLIRLLSVNCNEVNSLDKNEMTPLHWASDRGFSDMVSTLIKYNANINSKDSEGQTPLHYGKTDNFQEIPSNIKCTSTTNNATNQPGLNIKSPPSTCFCGHDEVVQVLLKFGADIYAEDNEGNRACDLYDGDFHKLFSDYLDASKS
ncbi:Acyl-CoA-binding domain-containing protein 6 [Schistosoma japonicum]|nr:Acyl-CoA-binding domain-containing protein 6 [Schistosoma japonicum]